MGLGETLLFFVLPIKKIAVDFFGVLVFYDLCSTS